MGQRKACASARPPSEGAEPAATAHRCATPAPDPLPALGQPWPGLFDRRGLALAYGLALAAALALGLRLLLADALWLGLSLSSGLSLGLGEAVAEAAGLAAGGSLEGAGAARPSFPKLGTSNGAPMERVGGSGRTTTPSTATVHPGHI